MLTKSSHYPVIYLEETNQNQVDWRVFIRYDRQISKYIMYGTRRPKEHTLHSSFPFYRMIFNSRSNLARWIMLNLNMDESDINMTMYNFDLNAVISDDFVGFNNLRSRFYETIGIDNLEGKLCSYSAFIDYLTMLSDVQ